MDIEPLTPPEFDAAVALWHQAGLTRPWNDPMADLRRAVTGPSSTVLAGRDGEGLVATAMVGHDGHRGWVYYVAVRADQRGRGHGRAMMEACEAWLAARDVPKINLMVRTENATVLAFYAALGYGRDDVAVLSKRLS
ncbi:MAG TPA: GNAT family acetyltransferase [Solirubrobacteraceae bacterium]|nr:GNAT family acetyltransferase [Solirubrobacteraceae bacterium]